MMTSGGPLVWLPYDEDAFDGLPAGLSYVAADPSHRVPSNVSEVEYCVVAKPTLTPFADFIPRMTRLQVLQTLSAGVDGIRQHLPKDVTLCSGRGIQDTATAEHAVTLTLASLRGIPASVRAQDEGNWATAFSPGLADKRVLVVGYGAIGAAIEQRLLPFEAEVVRVARRARPGVHGFAELSSLLPGADVAIIVAPLTSETRGLVNSGFLSRLKDGALLVNVARGPVVVSDDLVAACSSGRIRAALDVTDPEPLPTGHPLWGTPNVLVTPHVGGLTDAMEPRVRLFLERQLQRYADGRPLANVIAGEY
jgi:phosphoglycerate dehydrogenase-like enzyme